MANSFDVTSFVAYCKKNMEIRRYFIFFKIMQWHRHTDTYEQQQINEVLYNH